MTTAREYLRVSKGKGRTARSIDDQHRDNIAAEQDHGPWTWGEPYADTGSASKFATRIREDFDRLTADLATGDFGDPGDVLVLWEISRLARETGKGVKLIDLCEAGGYKIHVTSVNDDGGQTYDPSSYSDRHILIGGINDAEKEARLLSKRTRRGTDSALADGRPHGKRPFGYARRYEVIDGRSRPVEQYPDPVEAPLVVELFERVAGWNGRERESIRSVALDWERRGVVSREKGVPITANNMRPMLLRRAYIGERVHKGQSRQGSWEPLISRELFDAVQTVLSDPSRKAHTTSAVRHVLTNTLRCDVCGNGMTVTPGDRPKKNGTGSHGHAAYVCRRFGCLRISKASVDAYLIGDSDNPGAVLAYLSRDDVGTALAPDTSDSELSTVRAELSARRRDLAEFEQAPPARTLRETAERARSVEALESEVTALETRERALTMPDPLARLIETGPGAPARWETTAVTGQRAIAAVLLSETGPIGQCRVRRVADSPSEAIKDRLVFVRAEETG